MPGDGNDGGYNHLGQDVANDWNRLTNPTDRQNLLVNYYKTRPVLFTVIRDNGQRCIRCVNCKWLNTFVCNSCCQDGVRVYGGAIPDAPADSGWEAGVPFELQNAEPRFLGAVTQVKQ